MLTFTLLAHVLACVWYVIGEMEQPAYDKEEDFQWPGMYQNTPFQLYLDTSYSCILRFVLYALFMQMR